jgi:hypothetical protein
MKFLSWLKNLALDAWFYIRFAMLARIPGLSPMAAMRIGVALMVVGATVFYASAFYLGRHDPVYFKHLCFGGVLTMFSGIGFLSWFMFKIGI